MDSDDQVKEQLITEQQSGANTAATSMIKPGSVAGSEDQ